MQVIDKIFKRNDWYVTSAFGKRTPIQTSNGISSNFHNGCDYGTHSQKWPQYAIENGIVIDCGVSSDGAKYVVINYPKLNVNMLHYHLDSITVKKSQRVNSDTLVGYTGKTGVATGIHLHLSVYDLNKKKYIDPETFNTEDVENPTDYSIGDKVIVNGTLYSDSYGSSPGKTLTNFQGVITIINLKGTKPYHIDKLGWVSKKSINISNQTITYTVVEGDTLSSIAKKYNTTWQSLYEKNKNIIGSNPDIIKPGQIIEI